MYKVYIQSGPEDARTFLYTGSSFIAAARKYVNARKHLPHRDELSFICQIGVNGWELLHRD